MSVERLIGSASVLVELILKPEILLNRFRVALSEGSEILGWVNVNKMSSAKSDNLYSRCLNVTPFMSG